MNVFIIKSHIYTEFAYTNKERAEQDLTEELKQNYAEIESAYGEKISKNRVIVKSRVYKLNTEEPETTESKYDSIMLQAENAYKKHIKADDPYAFHKAFEFAYKEITGRLPLKKI